MGYDVTEVQKKLGGFDYPGQPDTLAQHAEQQGADSDLVETLRSIQEKDYDGPNAVMAALSEKGVLGGS